MNLLQKRRRSNRFGEKGLTDACRAVFPKQAAPKSGAFFSCHGPLPPSTLCGELRGGLSSRSVRRGEQRPVILKPRRSRPAGSIGLCGGSYCRRPHSARGKKEAGGSRLQICRRLKNRIANPVRLRLDKKEEKRNFTRNKNRTDYGKQRRNHPVKFCDNCRRRKNLPSGILQSGYDSINRL